MANRDLSGTRSYRTVDAKPTADSLIKPGELVDLVEVTPLTLNDRRIYNLLLENAWDLIGEPMTHSISKASLRGSHNSNDRIGESIERLMGAIVRVRINQNGGSVIERVQLLGGNIEHEMPDGMLHYEIPARLRRIIQNSTIFARLQKEVMFALTSKYSLTLYEMIQKRGNLSFRSSEVFSVAELRAILGVPKGKLTTWSNFLNRAIKPAVSEVNQLSNYTIDTVPKKQGKRVVALEIHWQPKDRVGANRSARELAYSKTGRRARREGRVEEFGSEVADGAAEDRAIKKDVDVAIGAGEVGQRDDPFRLQMETIETARLRHPGYDVDWVEQEWRRWAIGKDAPRDPNRAFLAFFRTFAERNPI